MPQATPTGGVPSSQLIAAVALWELLRAHGGSRSVDPDYRRFSALVDAFGRPRDVLDQWYLIEDSDSSDLFPRDDVVPALARAEHLTEQWPRRDHRVLIFGDDEYPIALSEAADAPPMLFVEGDVPLLQLMSVAIVGARKASDDGRRRARRAAEVMVEAGIVVVSGLAIGIDAAAHQATMDAGGRTIAVMGTPINRRYPAENTGLADLIVASGGALATEFLPGSSTKPWSFLRRNRTMAGLTCATLVVEASETSGARSQAHAALEQGRLVFLPSSLVGQHEWARKLVETGRQGLRAIEVERPEQVVAMIMGQVGIAEPTESF